MNDKIRQQYNTANPFEFKHIHNLKSLQEFDDTGPSVVMASPGMLQSGMSRQVPPPDYPSSFRNKMRYEPAVLASSPAR